MSTNALALRPNSYTDAKDWGDLMHALTETLTTSSSDEMILLLRYAASGQREGLPEHVHPVTYRSLNEVPELLLSNAPSVMRTIATRPRRQQPQVEPTTGVKPSGDHYEQGKQTPIDTPQEKLSDVQEAEVEPCDGDHEQDIDEIQVNAVKCTEDIDCHHSERERAVAARKIQAIYRRYLKRKNVVRKGMDETQAHFWHLLRKRSREMKWSKDSQYYLLFRVPLGDILVCLDVVGAFFESKKKDANERMGDIQNKELEELMEARNEYRYGGVIPS